MPMLVVPHDPSWASQFTDEAIVLADALAPHLVVLHHIGSTSIPGIHAKPVIDMLAVAKSLEGIDSAAPALVALGYQVMGEFGIAGRRYFRKDNSAGERTHHLHAFAAGSPHVARHLAFRDYLRAHPSKAAEYCALKRQLGVEPEAYMDGKEPFILATEVEALKWYHQQAGH